jgi:hypothetical protein
MGQANAGVPKPSAQSANHFHPEGEHSKAFVAFEPSTIQKTLIALAVTTDSRSNLRICCVFGLGVRRSGKNGKASGIPTDENPTFAGFAWCLRGIAMNSIQRGACTTV